MAEPNIAAAMVASLAAFAVDRGARRGELLRRAGLAESDLADPAARIPLARFRDLVHAAKELTNDPAIALHHGETVDVNELSVTPMVAAGSGSVTEAFAAMNRYARLSVDVPTEGGGDRFQFTNEGGAVWLIDRRLNPDDFPELTESSFARMVCSTRRALGSSPIFRAVHFTFAPPSYAPEFERVFQIPVVFSSDRNALVVDGAVLQSHRARPVPSAVTAVLRDHAESMLSKLDESLTTRKQVETVLTKAMADGNANVDFVARELAVSRQTLFRRLKTEGVTFARVLDDLRRALATHYLAKGESVRRTASLLGYSDPTAFARAFRRWTGKAPSQAGE